MDILRKIKNRSAIVGVIGLGYVGLPLVIRFCQEDFNVLGFDYGWIVKNSELIVDTRNATKKFRSNKIIKA